MLNVILRWHALKEECSSWFVFSRHKWN